MAGQHHRNPTAIAAANRPSLVGVEEVLGFRFESAIELSQEKMAEVHAVGKAARAAGEDEELAVRQCSVQWNAKEHPEAFDLVIYACGTVGRPSPILPDPNNVPTASIRLREFLRVSLGSLRKAADAAFAGNAPTGIVQH